MIRDPPDQQGQHQVFLVLQGLPEQRGSPAQQATPDHKVRRQPLLGRLAIQDQQDPQETQGPRGPHQRLLDQRAPLAIQGPKEPRQQ